MSLAAVISSVLFAAPNCAKEYLVVCTYTPDVLRLKSQLLQSGQSRGGCRDVTMGLIDPDAGTEKSEHAMIHADVLVGCGDNWIVAGGLTQQESEELKRYDRCYGLIDYSHKQGKIYNSSIIGRLWLYSSAETP